MSENNDRQAGHTEGLLSYCRETAIDYRPNLIYGNNGGSLVAVLQGGGPRRAITGPEEDANARRLVAAWNACGGIPTENLELAKYAATIAFLKTVEQQRDELLEALKEAAETLDRCRYSEQPMAKKCFALIAKMEKP
jgi:hypothetical protein